MSGPPPRPRKAAPPQSILPARRKATRRGAAAITEGDHLYSPMGSALPSTGHQEDLDSRNLPPVTVAAAQALAQLGGTIATEIGPRGNKGFGVRPFESQAKGVRSAGRSKDESVAFLVFKVDCGWRMHSFLKSSLQKAGKISRK